MRKIMAALGAISLITLGASGASNASNPSDGKQAASSETESGYNETAYAERAGGSTITSGYFDLSLDVPRDWVFSDKATAGRLMNVGAEVAAGDNDYLETVMDLSKQRTLPLFVLSKYDMDVPRPDNTNFLGVAENVIIAPNVKTGADYLDNVRQLVASSPMPIQFPESYTTRVIDGQTFDRADAVINVPNLSITQSYYAIRKGDHVISFVATYGSPAAEAEIERIIASIELDW